MTYQLEQWLQKYAEAIVKIGLNIQPGQRLLIGAPILWVGGAPVEAAPFVRKIAAEAYKIGARYVDVLWRDDQLTLARFEYAPSDSFSHYPKWQTDTAMQYAKSGDALLFIFADTPDLLLNQDSRAVSLVQQATFKYTQQVLETYARREVQGMAVTIATSGWGAKVFPGYSPGEQEMRLWDAILDVCRIKQENPISALKDYAEQLETRAGFLNRKQYAALKFSAPGTDLTVGLPEGHIWTSSYIKTKSGIPCITGLPCEELFTLPHRNKVNGVVTATKPLVYGGSLIEDFSLTFDKGRVVKVAAAKGEEVLSNLIQTDEGAARLGEVSLLPHSSPVSQSGMLFYNILIDENAASHVALGQAYRFNINGGENMTDQELTAAGGNQSSIHVDFMIGSGEMNIEGILKDDRREPVMRKGEWAFEG